jgi:hypothetical protein
MELLKSLGGYLLARAQERSTVAGAVAVLMTTAHLTLPPGAADLAVNAVVALAGLLAMAIPGGK